MVGTCSHNALVSNLFSRILFCLLPVFVLFGAAVEAATVGHVQFVAGEVQINGRDVSLNGDIKVGDILETGHDGFAHIKFIDNAFVSIRPGSEISVKAYLYDPKNPSKNQVEFELKKGVARSITGKAGESNKPGFKFKTPAAAIGIRGTDFIAIASNVQTRIRVFAGAIVALPSNCAQVASCSGVEPAVLEASADTYLELKTGQAPQFRKLVDLPAGSPLLDKSDDASSGQATDVVAEIEQQEQHEEMRELNDNLPSNPVIEGPYRGPDQIVWGRWHDMRVMDGTHLPSVTEALNGGKKVAVANNALALIKTDMSRDVMSSWESEGEIDMTLANSQAFLRLGNTLYSANVTDANMQLDLNNQTFNTALRVTYAEKGIDEALHASGSLNDQGFFFSDQSTSNMTVKGVLSSEGDQAGYLFDKALQEHVSIEGATLWSK